MTTPKQKMTEYLNDRGIAFKYAEQAGLRAVDGAEAKKLGMPYALPGIIIPYTDPWKTVDDITLMRIRYFDPPQGENDKPIKFAQPKASKTEAYFDPHVDWKLIAKSPNIPIYFVEGEIKALAMNQRGYTTIGLGGVDSFGGTQLTPWLRTVLA